MILLICGSMLNRLDWLLASVARLLLLLEIGTLHRKKIFRMETICIFWLSLKTILLFPPDGRVREPSTIACFLRNFRESRLASGILISVITRLWLFICAFSLLIWTFMLWHPQPTFHNAQTWMLCVMLWRLVGTNMRLLHQLKQLGMQMRNGSGFHPFLKMYWRRPRLPWMACSGWSTAQRYWHVLTLVSWLLMMSVLLHAELDGTLRELIANCWAV